MTTPANQTSLLEMAIASRATQLAIRARLMRDVARLWPLLDPKRLDDTFPGWLQAMITLVTSYHGQSAAAAMAYYRQARREATYQTAPSGLITIAAAPSRDWLTKAFGYSGPGTLTRDTTRPNTALSTTLGTAARIGLDGGRQTILTTVRKDPQAVGWFRVTDGAPCAFCALLASRGVVYKHDTVNFEAHNDCGCSGAPAFSRSQPLPDISKRAADVYRERGDGPALPAFRKAWNAHLAETA